MPRTANHLQAKQSRNFQLDAKWVIIRKGPPSHEWTQNQNNKHFKYLTQNKTVPVFLTNIQKAAHMGQKLSKQIKLEALINEFNTNLSL